MKYVVGNKFAAVLFSWKFIFLILQEDFAFNLCLIVNRSSYSGIEKDNFLRKSWKSHLEP